ncbi:hypothetical protein FACS1894199_02230 [Bacteroidia bacterium]|nr:hypothetical protein FACS1894199_02230 [Bacteroidia bacterium]
MKILRNSCRIFIGIIFIFSGFAKGIDPMGSEYKFIDYLNAFWLNEYTYLAIYLSFALSLTEFIVGICLFLDIKVRTASWGALLFLAFFTPLTLFLALTNPVTDCGCFGDALILTNWETFWKNIVLLFITIIVFSTRGRFRSCFHFWEQTTIAGIALVLMFGLEMYCYTHLPILDFRPYAIGKDINAGMTVPQGAELDVYKTILKYKNKKTGKVESFDETNFPWQDTINWEYFTSDSKLIKEGYRAPIHDFVISHPVYGDITGDVLEDENYTYLVVAYNLAANSVWWARINDLADYVKKKGYSIYGLTASGQGVASQFAFAHNIDFAFCSVDEIQLKTMIRSNPGIVVLKNGIVIDKWAYRDIPSPEEFQNMDPLAYSLDKKRTKMNLFFVCTLALLALTGLFAYKAKKYKTLNY